MTVQLLHLSDLHFGGLADLDQIEGLEQMLPDLRPDAVVITGDLTQRARHGEFQRARALVQTAARTAPVLVIPGNHDVAWWMRPLIPFAKQPLYAKYARYFGADLAPTLALPGAIIASALTSHGVAWGSLTPQVRDLAVKGHLPKREFARVRGLFEAAPPEQARVRVLHHNVLRGDISKRMGLARWRQAQRRIVASGAEVVLCGHDHQEGAELLAGRVVVSTAREPPPSPPHLPPSPYPRTRHPTAEAAMAPKFQGVDFYDVDSLLSEEERAVRDTVRAWVDENLIPIIGEHYIEGRFPKQLVPQMAELGLFGANLPEEYGCAGLNNVAYGLIMQELERGDSGVRSFASVQGALAMYPIYAFGSDEQKRRWLPKMASGEVIGCFGLTEPDYGSNPAGMITVAKETKDGWVLNGAKMWITNGSTAQIAVVWAKTGKVDDVESIRGFIVPTDTLGFSAKDQKGKLSLRASDTSEIVLQDVCVPKDALLPKSGGLKAPLMCLTQARYGIAWGAVGAAMACFDEAASYAKTRVMFGKPIGGFQLQQARLAEMLTEITKAQLLSLQLGRLKDQGKVTPQQVSLAKRNNVNIATDVARETRRLLGANGILAEYQAMRHLANLESVYTYEGTHDIHTLILGQEITGLSAFN